MSHAAGDGPQPVFRAVAWDDPAGEVLRDAQRIDIAAYYPEVEDSEPAGAHPTGDDLAVFVIAEVEGVPVACGGLRAIDATHGEIKRMFVAPAYRGSGLSTAVLRELETFARGLGWTRIVLETGDRMTPALRFYAREGFTPVEPWGVYIGQPFSVCLGKAL